MDKVSMCLYDRHSLASDIYKEEYVCIKSIYVGPSSDGQPFWLIVHYDDTEEEG